MCSKTRFGFEPLAGGSIGGSKIFQFSRFSKLPSSLTFNAQESISSSDRSFRNDLDERQRSNAFNLRFLSLLTVIGYLLGSYKNCKRRVTWLKNLFHESDPK